MAKKPRHPAHDRLVGDTSDPHIIEMDKPGLNWLPLRLAPQRFQSISGPFRKQTLTADAIEEFVRTAVTGPSIIKCALDFSEFFAIHYSSPTYKDAVTEIVHVAPYAPRDWIDSDNGAIRPADEAIADRIAAVWVQMEARFRSAHKLGDCRVLARSGSPVAEHFTAVLPDAFAAFKIMDWRNGIAESVSGDRLYSIYAAPPSKHDQKALEFVREFENSPVKLRVGQYFYRHHPEGLVGGVIRGALMTRIKDACFDQAAFGKIDEKTIRDAYKLFCKLLSSQPSAELLRRIEFRSSAPRTNRKPRVPTSK
ncbi:MAG: hypothetical protein K9G60_11560 [Pseudolabrys sp.]|nr:hypothetical protein [Pseudolabrys sp.]